MPLVDIDLALVREGVDHLLARAQGCLCNHGVNAIDFCLKCRQLRMSPDGVREYFDHIGIIRTHLSQDSAKTYAGIYFAYMYRVPPSWSVRRLWMHVTLVNEDSPSTDMLTQSRPCYQLTLDTLRMHCKDYFAANCCRVLPLTRAKAINWPADSSDIHRIVMIVQPGSLFNRELCAMRRHITKTLKLKFTDKPFHVSVDAVDMYPYLNTPQSYLCDIGM